VTQGVGEKHWHIIYLKCDKEYRKKYNSPTMKKIPNNPVLKMGKVSE
jgi:hypothetical protein